MVVILLIIFVFVVPQAKRIRISLGKDLETSEGVSEEGYRLLTKLFKINTAINLLVLINFLFAITHRYLG
jgi:4-hydroxybenzoate polyprenyltransferase